MIKSIRKMDVSKRGRNVEAIIDINEFARLIILKYSPPFISIVINNGK